MTNIVSLTAHSRQVLEGSQGGFYPGNQPVFSITVEGVTTITDDATLQMYVYKGSTNKSSTYLTGTMSASGNVITTKTFTGLIGGDVLFVTIDGTADGVLLTLAEFELRVRKRSGL